MKSIKAFFAGAALAVAVGSLPAIATAQEAKVAPDQQVAAAEQAGMKSVSTLESRTYKITWKEPGKGTRNMEVELAIKVAVQSIDPKMVTASLTRMSGANCGNGQKPIPFLGPVGADGKIVFRTPPGELGGDVKVGCELVVELTPVGDTFSAIVGVSRYPGTVTKE